LALTNLRTLSGSVGKKANLFWKKVAFSEFFFHPVWEAQGSLFRTTARVHHSHSVLGASATATPLGNSL
jgi:hypothetical protein